MGHLALPEIEDVFREYGIDPQTTTVQRAVERLRNRPPSTRHALIAGLDQRGDLERCCGDSSGGDTQILTWLKSVVQNVDSDDWRIRMREMVEQEEYDRLATLAESDDLLKQAPYTLRRLGQVLCERAGKLELGIAVLRRAQQEYSGDFWINNELARRLGELKPPQPNDVVLFSSNCVALQPQNVGARLNFGIALSGVGKPDQAIAELQKALELKPDYVRAWIILGNILRSQDKLDDAVAAYRQVLELDPQRVSLWLTVADILKQQNRLDEAIAAYRQAVRVNPQNDRSHIYLGQALEKNGNLDEAIAVYRRAMQLNPKDQSQYSRRVLAMALRKKGLLDESISVLREAVRLGPNMALNHFHLGFVLALKGHYEEAIAEYRESVRLRPDDPSALSNLAFLLAGCPDGELRDPAGAVKLAEKALTLQPKAGHIWRDLGHAKYRTGDWNGAIDALHKALELNKRWRFSETGFLLAMAHWQLGQRDQAEKWYKESVESMHENTPDWSTQLLNRLRAEAEQLMGIENQKSEDSAQRSGTPKDATSVAAPTPPTEH